MKCMTCGADIKQRSPNHKFCSAKCRSLSDRRVDRPSAEELHKLVWKFPTTKVAEMFGVSDVAIGKWCKAYGIDKPPRGYWAKKYSEEDLIERPHVDPPKSLEGYCPNDVVRIFCDEQIRQIRSSKASASKLAKIYGCNKSTICDILNYKTYREVR